MNFALICRYVGCSRGGLTELIAISIAYHTAGQKLVWLKTLNISTRTLNSSASVIFVFFSKPKSVVIAPGPLKLYCFALPVTPQTS
jgi:hypothetical protein